MAVVCDTCGASASEGAAFCSSCGATLTRPAAPPSEAAPSAPPTPPVAAASSAPPLSGVLQPPVAPGGYPPPPGAGAAPPPPPPPYVLAPGYGVAAPAPAEAGGYGPRPIEHILAYGYRLDIGAVLSEGWRIFSADIGGFIGFTFVGGIIAVLLAITLVGLLFYMPLLAGLWIVPLMMLKGRPHGFNDFFGGFKQLGQLILLGLVMGLLIMLGTIAFIIPGVYLGIAWTWALGLVLDRGMGFWEAMSTSLKVVNKNFWETLLLVLVIGVINSVGSMVVVGSLVTFPLSFCILVAGYKAVFGVDPRT